MFTKTRNKLLVHPITGESKICFPIGDYQYCNFTEKDGKIYRYSKKTDYIKFFRSKWRKKNDNSVDLIQKEKEPVSKRGSNSF